MECNLPDASNFVTVRGKEPFAEISRETHVTIIVTVRIVFDLSQGSVESNRA
jgi:hypothetical protein